MTRSTPIDNLRLALADWERAGGDLESVVSWGLLVSGAAPRTAEAPAPTIDELCGRLRGIGRATGALEAVVVAGFVRITEALFDHLAEDYGKSVAEFREAGRVLRDSVGDFPAAEDDLLSELVEAAAELGSGDLSRLAGYRRMLDDWRALTAPLVEPQRLYGSVVAELTERAAASPIRGEPPADESP